MQITPEEIAETLAMVSKQHLDIRTITLGLNLRSCTDSDINTMARKVYDKMTKAAEQLEDGVAQRTLVGHAAFHAFRNKLLRILLEVAILAALLHRCEGAHAAIDLELTTLIDFQRARRFLGARQQAAQHDGRAARRNRLHHIAGILDAAVGNY